MKARKASFAQPPPHLATRGDGAQVTWAKKAFSRRTHDTMEQAHPGGQHFFGGGQSCCEATYKNKTRVRRCCFSGPLCVRAALYAVCFRFCGSFARFNVFSLRLRLKKRSRPFRPRGPSLLKGGKGPFQLRLVHRVRANGLRQRPSGLRRVKEEGR